jgi:undecaprenyl-diphosphatase
MIKRRFSTVCLFDFPSPLAGCIITGLFIISLWGIGIVGLLAKKEIAEWFHKLNVPIQATPIIVMKIIMVLLASAFFVAERPASHTIGLAQALAIFPGVSRAGSTITAGLAIRLERETAGGVFHFCCPPPYFGASLKSL